MHALMRAILSDVCTSLCKLFPIISFFPLHFTFTNIPMFPHTFSRNTLLHVHFFSLRFCVANFRGTCVLKDSCVSFLGWFGKCEAGGFTLKCSHIEWFSLFPLVLTPSLLFLEGYWRAISWLKLGRVVNSLKGLLVVPLLWSEHCWKLRHMHTLIKE